MYIPSLPEHKFTHLEEYSAARERRGVMTSSIIAARQLARGSAWASVASVYGESSAARLAHHLATPLELTHAILLDNDLE